MKGLYYTSSMVRLNSHELSSQQITSLYTQLNKILAPKSPNSTGKLLEELLGYEERVMVAKRIACIVLLTEGYSLYKTAQKLHISTATAEKISKRLNAGSYNTILQRLGASKKSYFSVLDTIDSILHLGGVLPHYNGLDRYPGYEKRN